MLKIVKESKKNRKTYILFLILYIAFMLYVTLFSREPKQDCYMDLIPSWSYLQWMQGDWQIGKQIIGNILFFIPFGYMISGVMELDKGKKVFSFSCGGGALASFILEITQLLTKLGYFDIDDIFNNAIGALIGGGIYVFASTIRETKEEVEKV